MYGLKPVPFKSLTYSEVPQARVPQSIQEAIEKTQSPGVTINPPSKEGLCAELFPSLLPLLPFWEPAALWPSNLSSQPKQPLTGDLVVRSGPRRDSGHPAVQLCDPGQAGTFLAAAATTAPTTYTGTIDINFTIKLISAVPKGALLRCSGNVGLEYEVEEKISTLEIGLSAGLLESAENVDATVSGSTATCKLTIPYSWTVPASSSSSMVVIQGIVGSVGSQRMCSIPLLV